MPKRRSLWGVTTLIAIALVAVIWVRACEPGNPDTLSADRPECPTHEGIHIPETHEFGTLGGTTIPALDISGLQSNVVEYHDCQRFAKGSGERYGPMVAIFSGSVISTFKKSLSNATARDGSPVALAVAEVLSYDGDYSPLHISTLFNCLYMWRDQGGTLRARMVSIKMDYNACEDGYLPGANQNTDLVVYERSPGLTLPGSDVPAVARWDWDPQHSRQYIGIGCGDNWCEITAPGNFKESKSYSGSTTDHTERRVHEIKGWYDEQRLALPDKQNNLYASKIVGTLVPDPRLNDNLRYDVFFKKWVPVAAIAIDRDYNQYYKNKLNLEAGSVPATMNHLYQCAGTGAECGIPKPTVDALKCPSTTDPWWALMVSVTGRSAYMCVTRFKHPIGIPEPLGPGAARWRWYLKDETIWTRCPEGCCQVTGFS